MNKPSRRLWGKHRANMNAVTNASAPSHAASCSNVSFSSTSCILHLCYANTGAFNESRPRQALRQRTGESRGCDGYRSAKPSEVTSVLGGFTSTTVGDVMRHDSAEQGGQPARVTGGALATE